MKKFAKFGAKFVKNKFLNGGLTEVHISSIVIEGTRTFFLKKKILGQKKKHKNPKQKKLSNKTKTSGDKMTS